MNSRENFLRDVEMESPEWIPCSVALTQPMWHKYREKLEDLVLRHPLIFGRRKKGSVDFDDFGIRRKGNTITDEWGCVWLFLADGLQGQVIKHPLEDWATLENYEPPDPIALKIIPAEGEPPASNNFEKARRDVEDAKRRGKLAIGGCSHGFMFQRLYYLRGFKNLMLDFVREPPRLKKLIDIVKEYNMKIIKRWLNVGVDVLYFGDDLGTQNKLTINPKTFRKHIIPAYSEMFGSARKNNVYVYLHSDGHIMEIAEDLIKAGVTILNLQDLVNGVDNIRKRLKGKVCIDRDIDRQKILPFGTPEDVKKHVRRAVKALCGT